MTSAARPVASDGLTDREREIMRLYDDGTNYRDIAAQLDLSAAQVKRVVGRYSLGQIDAWMASAQIGSASLLRALRRHHPNRCGAAR